MTRVIVIDGDAERAARAASALRDQGWDVDIAGKPEDLAPSESADAIVLTADVGSVSTLLPRVQDIAEACGAAMVLVTDLDRSGWDRTFGSPEALQVDALFDLPVDPAAVVRRLQGILQARAKVELDRRAPTMRTIIERAIANEEAAEAFYQRAASAVSRPDTKEILLELAGDEREHRRLLEEFRSGARSLPSEHAEPSSLVESLGTPEITPDMAPADAFVLAARKEKLAVEFYENWAALYAEGPERELLKGLADVERRHQARVEGLFSEAAFPENW